MIDLYPDGTVTRKVPAGTTQEEETLLHTATTQFRHLLNVGKTKFSAFADSIEGTYSMGNHRTNAVVRNLRNLARKAGETKQRTFTIRYARLVVMERQFNVDVPADADDDTAQNIALTKASKMDIQGDLSFERGDNGELIVPPGATIDDISDYNQIWELVGEEPAESAEEDDDDDNWNWDQSDRDSDRTF